METVGKIVVVDRNELNEEIHLARKDYPIPGDGI